MSPSLRTSVAAAYLLLCLMLGGASAAGILANVTLQLLAAIILAAIVLSEPRRPVTRPEKLVWLLALAFAALILLQLVPLPPSLWTALPGRDGVARGFALLDVALPWLPLSLTPDATVRSLVSPLPGAALFALIAPASGGARRLFLPLILFFSLTALLLGLTQIAAGPQSPLYFYAVTNAGSTVGFFANRNHQATLLLMTLPFVAALAAPLFEGGRVREGAMSKMMIVALLFAVVAGGVVVTGSRAGISLLPMVAALCVLMVRKDLAGNVPKTWAAATVLFLVAAVAAVGNTGVVTRDALAAGPVAQSTRESIWANTARLTGDFQPAGSGLGSFVDVYRMAEDPLDRPDEYTNHAHNDYLEWLLETGVPGIVLLLAFLVWFALRVRRVWSQPGAALGRAGSIAIGAVLLHSLVDYPIRTAAIAALCALCLALMIPAPDEPAPEARP